MRRTVLWLVPLLALVPVVGARGQDKADKQTPAQQYKALQDEFRKARQEQAQAYRQAKTDPEKKKVEEQIRKKRQEFAGRFLELAQKNPKEPFAFEALAFVALNSEGGAEGDKAAELLLKDHAAKLPDLMEELGSATDSPAAEKVLRGLLDKSSDKKVQAAACLSLGQLYKSKSEAEGVKPADAEKAAKEAEGFFDRVVTKYADVKEAADAAKGELFEIRNLGIGKSAPDISGEDGDGKKFKLSDYRGKVVVLDFWANW